MASPGTDWVFINKVHPFSLESEYRDKGGSLFPGEKVLDKHDVKINIPQISLDLQGSIFVTNWTVCFMYQLNRQWCCLHTNFPLQGICDIKSLGEASFQLITRNLRETVFVFDSPEIMHTIMDTIERLAFWKDYKNPMDKSVFAFTLKEAIIFWEGNSVGMFHIEEEYQRMRISDEFVIRNFNEDFRLCPSYPKQVILPRPATFDMVLASSKFRSHGRFPAVCWVHPQTKVTLSRCSQPLMRGICTEDQPLVSLLFPSFTSSEETCSPSYFSMSFLSSSKSMSKLQLVIVDARSEMVAKFCYTRGGGHENIEKYPNCSIQFMAIDNIHKVSEAWKNFATVESQLPLNQTKWAEHIKLILKAATETTLIIFKKKCSVLVHCSDGWDRTSQIIALSELMMDPFYRTIYGFGILIQKEWLQFGHKFADRIGYGEKGHTQEQSPIFVLFLECVYQLLCKYPTCFEFNEDYLITLIDELYSCRFGTFLMNCEKEREKMRIETETVSIWPWLLSNENIARFKNKEYNSQEQSPIIPDTSITLLQDWPAFYNIYKNAWSEEIPRVVKHTPNLLDCISDDYIERCGRNYNGLAVV
uniref:Myotubularin phosphatase domain-containing protein n=1 Tax=Arcella intermedia TaxID=1963864 RepID=A0A6B2L0F5_9EUKA|eukprot:TRINITY_DN911_c1_g1_i2.p1 TRINITY_DN911_c1_g1~~TRINITY_DN911_c1_g1_i2.p1  ORF type:complete len:587 (-),score=73.74 TRINITY_DN911_c1_g1_i2:82-1842(-)